VTNEFEVKCDCGAVTLAISGIAKVHGFCHCVDCRDLLDIPYHSVAVWGKEDVTFKEGEGRVSTFQHPTKRMKRIFCSNCGEVLFNTSWIGVLYLNNWYRKITMVLFQMHWYRINIFSMNNVL